MSTAVITNRYRTILTNDSKITNSLYLRYNVASLLKQVDVIAGLAHACDDACGLAIKLFEHHKHCHLQFVTGSIRKASLDFMEQAVIQT